MQFYDIYNCECELHYRYSWSVEWLCSGGDKNLIGFESHTLKGWEVEIGVVTEGKREGGMLFGPLNGEFLQVAESSPQVNFLFEIQK